MIHRLQEISAIFISQNRLVEGKDYVRAEWLKKSGLARIDIPTNYNMVDSVTCYFKNYGGTQGQMPVFGGNKIHALLWLFWNISSTNKSNRLDTYFDGQFFFDIPVTEGKFKVKFNWQTKKRLISWNDVDKGGWLNCALDKTNTKISVLDCGRFNQPWHIHNGALAMKYFFLAPNIYLYPCQLLQDIPSTLDANGKARQAGECGMIDSISGKFYGNVASSGSFSVEGLDESGTVEDTRLHQIYKNKLVEGEDYMIGEQLATTVVGASADGGGYIGAMLKLPDDYLQFSVELNLKKVSSNLILEMCVSFVAANKIGQGITRRYGNKHITYSTTGSSVNILHDFGVIEGDMIIQVTQSEVIVNGVSAARVASPNAPQCFIGMSNRALKYSNIIKVTQDDSRIFVPCRLLRPIPRNLDAQCKPRVAGECGMIDLISGRFYGNVASSGTFSLAWDEWLKDCSIQFDANYLGWTMQYPPTISYQGRIKVANLPDELTDFGFVKLSKTQVVMGENVWSFNNWGSGTWATFNASYGGGYGCGCSINGSSVGSQQEQVATELSCSIDLQDIIQINKIEFIAYIDQQTTHTVKFTRGFDETLNKQYLISDYDNTRIYAD